MTIADGTVSGRALDAGPIRTRSPGRRLAVLSADGSSADGPDRAGTADLGGPDQAVTSDRSMVLAGQARSVRSWPLLLLAIPATVAVWSGWVGIGQMTGFGQVHPLPGIWDSLHLDTAVTLPFGVEAYAAYALRAWLSASAAVSDRTRRFARWSAIGSLLLGMAGQVAYHLLTQDRVTHAPWGVTTAVSCLPVLVLGMGAALAHMLRSDALSQPGHGMAVARSDHSDAGPDRSADVVLRHRLGEAEAAARRLTAAGERVSRRNLRRAGLRGSNTDLGLLARTVKPEPLCEPWQATSQPMPQGYAREHAVITTPDDRAMAE
jgi:hypothetical protein